MKRLLTLFLVLALASTAGAAGAYEYPAVATVWGVNNNQGFFSW